MNEPMIARQLIRFAFVGGGATALHFLVALQLNTQFGLTPFRANLVAFATAWSLSYFGNYVWTFESGSKHSTSMPRFVVVSLLGLLASQTIVMALTGPAGLAMRWALIPVVLVVPAISFIANRSWVFQRVSA